MLKYFKFTYPMGTFDYVAKIGAKDEKEATQRFVTLFKRYELPQIDMQRVKIEEIAHL